MPSFNTQLFKLATPEYLTQHVFTLNEVSDDFLVEQARLDQHYKQVIKASKRQHKVDFIAQEDTESNKLDFILMGRQVDELFNQISDCGFPDDGIDA